MLDDCDGLLRELRNTGQRVAFTAVTNTLMSKEFHDRINGSRVPSATVAGSIQDTASKDERTWSERMAGSTNMSSGLSALARVQEKRREAKKITNLPNKTS